MMKPLTPMWILVVTLFGLLASVFDVVDQRIVVVLFGLFICWLADGWMKQRNEIIKLIHDLNRHIDRVTKS